MCVDYIQMGWHGTEWVEPLSVWYLLRALESIFLRYQKVKMDHCREFAIQQKRQTRRSSLVVWSVFRKKTRKGVCRKQEKVRLKFEKIHPLTEGGVWDETGRLWQNPGQSISLPGTQGLQQKGAGKGRSDRRLSCWTAEQVAANQGRLLPGQQRTGKCLEEQKNTIHFSP